jgi:hypothetical protein
MGQYHEVTGDHPTLSIGASGEWVSYAQQLLTNAGYPPQDHQIDGLFGPLTNEAVRDFQGAHHLHVDGIIGPATWAALEGGGGGGGGSSQLEFGTQPFVDTDGWLKWTVTNTGSGTAAAGTSGGAYECYEGDTTIPGDSIPLAADLEPHQESGYLAANLLHLTPNDGSYQASVQVGQQIVYVNYVVRDGKVEPDQ